jgi:hypothetical protein
VRTTPFSRVLVLLWPWLLAVLIMAPLLRPGYVLSYDMVFVPDQAWRSQYLGLGDGLPRAVPSDALVSWLTVILPSWLLQKLVLIAIVVAGGFGVLRLLAPSRPIARLAAVSWFVWNPYLAERLLIGQWVVLVGYAALPWILLAALGVRDGRTRAVGALVVATAVGATSASGGLMAALLGLVVVFWPGSSASMRQRIGVGAGALAVNLPWIVAGLLHRDSVRLGADAVRAFAASGEGHLGAFFSVVGLGGIWNTETVPDSRTSWIAILWLVLLIAAVLSGIRPLVDVLGRQVVSALAVVAGISIVLGLGGVINAGLLASLADNVPGLALLRDGTRYLGGLALFQALAFGLGVERWALQLGDVKARRMLAIALALTPLAVMPDLAWGAAGRLEPVDYPSSWGQARQAMVDDGGGGRVLVLPPSPYRSYPWNDGRSGLDPAPRFFPNDMLTSDALRVDGEVVQAETPAVQAAYDAFRTGDVDGLRRLGVGYLIVDAELDDARPQAEDLGATTVFEADDIVIYALPSYDPVHNTRSDEVAVAVAWGAAGVTLCLAIGTRFGASGRPRRRREQTS